MTFLHPIFFFIFFHLLVQPVLILDTTPDVKTVKKKELSVKAISLENRYGNEFVNDVFKDNILLNIAYMAGKVKTKEDINWKKIQEPFEYKFVLKPNKTFAFHNDVLEKYKKSLEKTTNANFNFDDGFKSDGYLTGDGVCHLASLIYWSAKDAGLAAFAPTNHDFAVIPEINKEYGVSIYKAPGSFYNNAMQNLYVTNNRKKEIVFNFSYKNDKLKLSIYEELL